MRIIFLFFGLSCFGLKAQANIDSLWGIWSDTSVAITDRLDAIYNIAWDGFLFSQPDSAFSLAQLQFELAQKNEQKKQMASALNLQGNSLLIRGELDSAIDYYYKCLKISEEIDDTTSIAKTYGAIGNVYYNRGEYAKAINYQEKGLKALEEAGEKLGVANAHNNIGAIFLAQGNYNKAISCFLKCLEIEEEIGDESPRTSTYGNIGLAYFNQGEYTTALKYYNKGLLNADDWTLSLMYNNIAIVYREQGDFDKAMYYSTESLKLSKAIGRKQGIAVSLTNIGVVYYERKDYIESLNYYSKCLEIQKDLEDKNGIALTLNNIAVIYHDLGEYTKANDNYLNSLTISEEVGDKMGISRTLNNLGINCITLGEFNKAHRYSSQSFLIAEEIQSAKEIKDASRVLFSVYVKMDSIEEAMLMADLVCSLRLKDLRLNFPSLSEQQKEMYFATMSEDFDLLYDFALHHPEQLNQLDLVFDNTLITKGLLLKSSTAMLNAVLTSGDSTLVTQYEDWIALKKRIAIAYSEGAEIKELEEQAGEVEKELVKGSLEFHDMRCLTKFGWTRNNKSMRNFVLCLGLGLALISCEKESPNEIISSSSAPASIGAVSDMEVNLKSYAHYAGSYSCTYDYFHWDLAGTDDTIMYDLEDELIELDPFTVVFKDLEIPYALVDTLGIYQTLENIGGGVIDRYFEFSSDSIYYFKYVNHPDSYDSYKYSCEKQ